MTAKKKSKATTEVIQLGGFDVVSSVLRISDPCYDKKTWCAGTVENVLIGEWQAQVTKIDEHDDWGNRCRELLAWHSSIDNPSNARFKKLKIDVGVDSGQAGIFDDKFFKVDYDSDYPKLGNEEYTMKSIEYSRKEDVNLYKLMAEQEKNPEKKKFYEDLVAAKSQPFVSTRPPAVTRDWYEICCDKTLSNVGAGVIRNGCVSSSGDGDGSYNAYALYNRAGIVLAVKIKF